jgi:lysylphosphatidylglycerol synthetase-like protein (DUF2156 family)
MYISAEQFYAIGITPGAGQQQANNTASQIDQIRQTTTWGSIFANNFEVSIMLLVPAAGLVSFLVVLFNTGQVLGLLAASSSISPIAYVLATAIPIGFMEVFAYSLLGAEGTYLFALGINRNGFRDRLKSHSWKSVIVYIVILVLAAIIENALIQGGI